MVILIRERGRTCQYSLRTGWQHLLSHIVDYFLTSPSKWSNFFVESHSQIWTFKKRAKSKFPSLFFFGCFNASFSEWDISVIYNMTFAFLLTLNWVQEPLLGVKTPTYYFSSIFTSLSYVMHCTNIDTNQWRWRYSYKNFDLNIYSSWSNVLQAKFVARETQNRRRNIANIGSMWKFASNYHLIIVH